jgi:hypothetical protein
VSVHKGLYGRAADASTDARAVLEAIRDPNGSLTCHGQFGESLEERSRSSPDLDLWP